MEKIARGMAIELWNFGFFDSFSNHHSLRSYFFFFFFLIIRDIIYRGKLVPFVHLYNFSSSFFYTKHV